MTKVRASLSFAKYMFNLKRYLSTKISTELRTKKSTGVDMMPLKLVKLAANYLAGPLSQSINNSIKKGCFRFLIVSQLPYCGCPYGPFEGLRFYLLIIS